MAQLIALLGSGGGVALVDDADFHRAVQLRWRLNHHGYVVVWTKGSATARRLLTLGRFILDAPVGVIVDHRNGDPLDNRRANLRAASPFQNSCNRRKRSGASSSRFKGVTWNKRAGKWQASLKCNGVSHYLGVFQQETDAARAYDTWAKTQHGEFAVLNFPEIEGSVA